MLPALIMVTTLATSSTGGNYAGPGGVVSTGSSYSSSAVVNSVSATGSGSVHVETDINGQRHVLDRQIPAGQPMTIEVRTTSRNGVSSSSVRIGTSTTRTTVTRPDSAFRTATTTRASITAQASSSAATSTSTLTGTVAPAVPLPPPAPLTPGWSMRVIQALTSFIRSLFGFVP